MTFKKQNPWKLLSVGLLGIIAVGLLAPVSAAPPSGDSESQLDALFNLVNEVLLTVQGIDTDLDDLSGNVTAIKTETDKIPMIKSDVTAIKTETDKIPMIKTDVGQIEGNVTAIKTETDKIQMVKDDVGSIKTDVNTLVSSSSSIFRIEQTIEDGADDLYDGTITIDRVSGSGVFLIERLYVCSLQAGIHTGAGDGVNISYITDGRTLENPDSTLPILNKFFNDSTSTSNSGCIDLLYANDINGQITLAGDGTHNVGIVIDETDVDDLDDDSDHAEIVAYISGLSDPSDIQITSTTDNS